jgi:hypothetical protein
VSDIALTFSVDFHDVARTLPQSKPAVSNTKAVGGIVDSGELSTVTVKGNDLKRFVLGAIRKNKTIASFLAGTSSVRLSFFHYFIQLMLICFAVASCDHPKHWY